MSSTAPFWFFGKGPDRCYAFSARNFFCPFPLLGVCCQFLGTGSCFSSLDVHFAAPRSGFQLVFVWRPPFALPRFFRKLGGIVGHEVHIFPTFFLLIRTVMSFSRLDEELGLVFVLVLPRACFGSLPEFVRIQSDDSPPLVSQSDHRLVRIEFTGKD